MHPNIAANNHQLETLSINGWKVGFFSMLLVVLLLVGLLFFQFLNQPITLVPNGEGKQYSLSRNGANKDYLTDLTFDWMTWWGNITPDNIGYTEERLMKMVSSSGYGEVKSQLADTKLRVKNQQISTVWQPREMEVDAKTLSATISGSLRTYLGSTMTSDIPKKYRIVYTINLQGRAHVLSFKEIDANKYDPNK
jgi:conjugal transfer pilus assembly protein TraE